jgi:hypothetical protein
VRRAPISRSGASPTNVSRTGTTAAVLECNRLAAQAPRDRTRSLPHGLAGDRSGFGPGTLYGLSEHNRRSEHASAAYRSCMARRGWY